jgi:diguanylate cyclase (GGDEF)-like protein
MLLFYIKSTTFDCISINYATEKVFFSHIQFIDVNGDEKIRVNRSGKEAYAVPLSELQNKKGSDYFTGAIGLKKEGIFISRLDLSRENGKVIEPYIPVMHFSKPVYDENGKLEGIIAICYLADNFLKTFREIAKDSEGEIVLLDSEGFWVSGTKKNLEYGFMFEDRKDNNFSKKYAEEWASVIKGSGQIVTPKGLFTFSTVNIVNKITETSGNISGGNINAGSPYWYVVSSVPRDGNLKSLFTDKIFPLIIDIAKQLKFYLIFAFIGAVFIALLIYANRKGYAKIHYYSEYDVFTKVFNRRAGMERLDKLFSIDERRRSIISICFIDINGLKQVNDSLGHNKGDELILTVVRIIKSAIRESDFVIRLGGDEFLVVFMGIDIAGSEAVWERIKSAFERINLKEDRPYLISVSHGLACYSNEQKSSLDDLMKIADEKMYEEKKLITKDWNALKAKKGTVHF